MPQYMVTLRLQADDQDALLQRLTELGLADDEGVMGIATQPEHVHVPPELQPPAPSIPPPPPPDVIQPIDEP